LDPWVLCCLDPLEWLLAQWPHPVFLRRQRGLCVSDLRGCLWVWGCINCEGLPSQPSREAEYFDVLIAMLAFALPTLTHPSPPLQPNAQDRQHQQTSSAAAAISLDMTCRHDGGAAGFRGGPTIHPGKPPHPSHHSPPLPYTTRVTQPQATLKPASHGKDHGGRPGAYARFGR